MTLQFSPAGTSDVAALTAISKHAFDSDAEVGAPSAGGLPDIVLLFSTAKWLEVNTFTS